ncbi:mucin-13-like isoform X2 [Sardina pilchardus]|uniref:mucin-13-like isoform X2 n=1 Tax=Sardina pilchardus TaxID=27697 RepID=UPI002E1045DA
MAVMAKLVVLVLIATFSNVFGLPKRDVTKGAEKVDVSTTPNPTNQTQTEAPGGASEDVGAGTPAPDLHNQTTTAQPDLTDGASEDDMVTVTVTPSPQNQTTAAAQTGDAESPDELSEDAKGGAKGGTTTQNAQNQTTSAPTVTDGPSEDAVLTTVLNQQNGTTSAQDETTITESPGEPSEDAEGGAKGGAKGGTTTQNAQNQTTSAPTVGTDGPSEDAVLTTVLNQQNGTTSAQDETTITDRQL